MLLGYRIPNCFCEDCSSRCCAFFRAAHNSFFFLISALPGLLTAASWETFVSNLARFSLSHIVKELVSRGLKSRSGNCNYVAYRDRLAVSRVGACRVDGRNLVQQTPIRQYVSCAFFSFFSAPPITLVGSGFARVKFPQKTPDPPSKATLPRG